VVVYLDGDNNLEPFSLKDLEEMERAMPAKGVSWIVLLDRAKGYSRDEGDWEDARVILVRPDPQTGIHSEVLAAPGELNMGDPKVLESFLAASLVTFPAQRHGLVLWNHGGGWVAHISDENAPGVSTQHDKLTLPELRTAVQGALRTSGLDKLDLVAFDMCLMAQLETAYELEGLAEVMVGSEASAPGDGWPYDQVVPLFADHGRSTREVARGIVKAFDDYYRVRGSPIATHSALDLAMVRDVVTHLDAFLGRVENSLPQSWPALIRSLFFSVNYGDLDDLRRGAAATLSVDLGDACRNLTGSHPDLRTSPEYTGFKSALNRMVLESRASPRYRYSQGVAIYAPFRPDLLNSDYRQTRFARNSRWLRTLSRLYTLQADEQKAPAIKRVDTVSVYRKQRVPEVLQLGQDGFSFVFEGTNVLWSLALIGQRDEAERRTLVLQKSFLGAKADPSRLRLPGKDRETLLQELSYPDGELEVSFRYDATRYLVTNGRQTFPATIDVSDVSDLQAHLIVVPAIYEQRGVGKYAARIYFDWLWRAAAVTIQVPQADGNLLPAQIEPHPEAVIHLLQETIPDQGERGHVVSGSLKWHQGLSLTLDLNPPGPYEVILGVESLSGQIAVSRHRFPIRARDDDLTRAIRLAPPSDYVSENFLGEWEIIDAEKWFRDGRVVSIGAFKRYDLHPARRNLLKVRLTKPRGRDLFPGLDMVEVIDRTGLPHLRRYVLDQGLRPSPEYGVQMSLPIFDFRHGQLFLLEMDLVTGDLGVAIKRSGPRPQLAPPTSIPGPAGGVPQAGTYSTPPPAPAPRPAPGQSGAFSPVSGTWQAQNGEAVVFTPRNWTYFENGVAVDGGPYWIQGRRLTTRSTRSGQTVPYDFQISGQWLILTNPSGERYSFYRVR